MDQASLNQSNRFYGIWWAMQWKKLRLNRLLLPWSQSLMVRVLWSHKDTQSTAFLEGEWDWKFVCVEMLQQEWERTFVWSLQTIKQLLAFKNINAKVI